MISELPLREKIHETLAASDAMTEDEIQASFSQYATGAVSGALIRLAEEERIERTDDGYVVVERYE